MKQQGVYKTIMALTLAMSLCACGGGEGGSSGTGGGGGSTTAVTFSANVTAIVLEDSRSGEEIAIDGLPLSGATVTRN